MSNNTRPAGQIPMVEGAFIKITTFTTGQPPRIDSNVDLAGVMELLSIGIKMIASALRQPPKKDDQPPVDKKREYLGPRK